MKFNIRVKLVVLTFCAILLVGGSIFFYTVYQGRHRILTTFEKDARETAVVISGTVANDLYVLDLGSLRLRLESARANPNVSHIYVTDLKGVVLADGTKENALRDQRLTDSFSREVLLSRDWISQIEGELLKVGGPVFMPDGSRIGHLHVGFSLRHVNQMIDETTRTSFYITLFCLGIGALLADFLSTTFSRPILAIAQASREIGRGKLDTRLPVKGDDELGMLAQSINRMAEALQTREAEVKRAQEKLRTRYQELEILYDIGQRVLSSPELQPVLEKILDQILSVISVDIGNVRLFDRSGRVVLGAYRGYRDPENVYRHRVHVYGSGSDVGTLLPQVIASKESLVVEDVPAGEGLRTFKKEGVQSALIVPIATQEKVLGFIEVGSRTPRKFEPGEIRFLEAIGNQIGLAVQKAWLFEESEHNLERIRALHDIGTAITSTLDLSTVLNVLLEKTDVSLPYPAAAIRLFNRQNGLLEPIACRNLDEEEWRAEKWKGGRGLANVVFETKTPMIVPDCQTDARVRDLEFYRKHRLRSYLGVPLMAKGEVLGVLSFFTKEKHEFTKEEIEFLSALAGEAAIAINNARLFEEAEQRVREQGAISAIATAVSQSLDVREILTIAMDKALEVTGRERASIRLKDPVTGKVTLAAHRGLSQEEVEDLLRRVPHQPSDQVFASGQPLIVNNRSDAQDPQLLLPQSRSVAWIPMKAEAKVAGVLGVSAGHPIAFAEHEVELLQAIGNVIGVALENARLYEETERRRREAEELARVAQSLTESLDMTAVGERIVTSVRELLGVNASTLRLLQTDGSLRTLASTGEGFSISSGGDVLPSGTGLASVAVAEGRPIWSADVLNEPEIRLTDQMRDYQLRSGNRSMIAVPLRAHEKIVGSLGLADQTGRIYSDSEVALLQTFADQAALAINNSQLYEQTKKQAAELEKANRVQADFSAMIIHDVRGSLAAIIAAAAMLEDGRLGSVNEDQGRWLVKIGAHGRRLADLVNNFLDLSKLEAGHIDLERERVDLQTLIRDSLDGYLVLARDKRITIKSRIAPTFPRIYADPRRLDQVLGNLVGNALKFTPEGGEIEVGAAMENRAEGKVWVKDNGVGIPSQEFGEIFQKYRQTRHGKAFQREGTGLGLVICKMIVEAHGGRIWVESEEDRGTTFYFTLPLSV